MGSGTRAEGERIILEQLPARHSPISTRDYAAAATVKYQVRATGGLDGDLKPRIMCFSLKIAGGNKLELHDMNVGKVAGCISFHRAE